jgi:hypothetical protein
MTPAEIVVGLPRGAERARRRSVRPRRRRPHPACGGAAGPRRPSRDLATLEHDLDRPTATIHHVVAEDDLVVVHLTMNGRHVASTMPLLAGLPPTGDAVAWDFIHIWRVEDDLIVEHWACRDDVGLLAQVRGWPPQ